jgi:hypothetical protein
VRTTGTTAPASNSQRPALSPPSTTSTRGRSTTHSTWWRHDRLIRQPVGLAKQATERALGTDDPAVRVETTQAALEHYRDALTVVWGADREHPYDREELRYRVALLADGLVDARQAYAARLEAIGDTLAVE